MASDSDSDSPNSSSSPNKRLKTLTTTVLEPEFVYIQSQSTEDVESSKQMEESDSSCCGICLSEEGKFIRGKIDSCDHHFCFVCIMEWAKIESKCPLCKRRFTTIRRPPKQGVFSCERIVNVPQRDQVYHHHGNVSRGPSDPYANVQCIVCHGSNDECLLLLCDLCDTAAHTYCVGLGATVPEGDWFCYDCTVLRAEHSNAEKDTENVHTEIVKAENFISSGNDCWLTNSMSEHESANVMENGNATSPSMTNVSIINIVSDIPNYWRRCLREPTLSDNLPQCGGAADVINFSDARPHQNVASNPTELGARTLRHCRNVHGHIQALRKNWDSLRNGSLTFRSSSVESAGESSKRGKVRERSNQVPSSSSRSSQQLKYDNHLVCHNNIRSPCDIEKAWKMMEKAKAMGPKSKSGKSVNPASKHATVKQNSLNQATSTSSSIRLVKQQPLGNSGCQKNRMEQQYNHQKSKSHRQIKIITAESCNVCPTTPSHCSESMSARKVHIGYDEDRLNRSRHLAKNTCEASSSISNEKSRSLSISSNRLISGTFDSSRCSISSSHSVDTAHGERRLEKSCMKSKAGQEGDAKSEIQSLVKLNLKLLSRDKKLGYDAFKEVARSATHAILAACGLEQAKPGIRCFLRSVICSHPEDIKQLHKSTLMPNCCRECFYVFVKDVVNSIMIEKVDKIKAC